MNSNPRKPNSQREEDMSLCNLSDLITVLAQSLPGSPKHNEGSKEWAHGFPRMTPKVPNGAYRDGRVLASDLSGTQGVLWLPWGSEGTHYLWDE